jgi:hypothetical protein
MKGQHYGPVRHRAQITGGHLTADAYAPSGFQLRVSKRILGFSDPIYRSDWS